METKMSFGDIYKLGRHFLLMGDSTEEKMIKEYLKNKNIKLCITDPPYGVDYQVRNRKKMKTTLVVKEKLADIKIKNDHRASWSKAFLLSGSPILYVWYPSSMPDVCINAIRESGYTPKQSIIWLKNRFTLSRSAYHWKHESCCYSVKNGETSNWVGDRKQHTIWEEKIPDPKERVHPTQKPVGLYTKPILNHTVEKDLVYDPFAGSGTIFEACEITKRTAVSVEYDAEYCSRIIKRWEDLTKKKAKFLKNIFYEEVA